MIHEPIITRAASSQRLTSHINPPRKQSQTEPITITTYYSTAPVKSKIASIVGPHRIIRMAINGNQPGPQPGIWDVLISDNAVIDNNARLTDQRISGKNTGQPGFFAAATPDIYTLNIVSQRPITYYKLIDQSLFGLSTFATATLTAIRL